MKKVLIANRGEISVRIIRACNDLGISTVAVYSKADKNSLNVLLADEAICIGENVSAKSYLKISNILAACEITGADSIHPGYGFLSENSKFAAICESSNVNFIGPSSNSIELLGNKIKAKEIAKKAKCPVVPGSDGVVNDSVEALQVVKQIGLPVILKAVAGGGGRGIRIVNKLSELDGMFSEVKAEAMAGFGCSDIYIEKLIENPRHIEVQVIGDKYGNYVHLGERDCSIQRRRQKLVEEAPSPILSQELRNKVGKCAIEIARGANYWSVGTVEFLLDKHGKFYFMEMNTRIQVEHTVTEELTGIDLVKTQLLVSTGEKLPFKQKDIVFNGHVIQCRINAENPFANFRPCPGKINELFIPGGPWVRVDTACYSGCTISQYYDSMIAKLIVKGKNREEAIARMKRALKEFYIEGIDSTIPFHKFIMNNDNFINSKYDIKYIDDLIAAGCDFDQ